VDEKVRPIGFWKKLLIVVLTTTASYFLLATADAHNHKFTSYDLALNFVFAIGFTYALFFSLQSLETEWSRNGEAVLIQGCILTLTTLVMSSLFLVMLDWSRHYGIQTWWAFPIAVLLVTFIGVLIMLFTDWLDDRFPVVVEKGNNNG